MTATHGGEPVVYYEKQEETRHNMTSYGFKYLQGERRMGVGFKSEQAPTPSLNTDAAFLTSESNFQPSEQHINSSEERYMNERKTLRRLTPLECTRLQGFPDGVVDFPNMSKCEYIAWSLASGRIVLDYERENVNFVDEKNGETRELQQFVSETGLKTVNVQNGKSIVNCSIEELFLVQRNGVSSKETSLIKYSQNDVLKQEIIFRLYEKKDILNALTEKYGIAKNRVAELVYEKSWLDIGEWTDTHGKLHKESDTPKYKALGNSIALPFWEWMADRMAKYLYQGATMASLFDGIGGFPISFSKAGINPVWTSEIEEFPIAVVKKHFGDEENGIEGDYI